MSFFWLVLALFSSAQIARQIYFPALPLIKIEFDVSRVEAIVVLTLSMFVFAAAMLFYGHLADNLGTKKVLLSGLCICMGGSVIAAIAPNIWILIGGIFVQGLGVAGAFVLSRSIALQTYGQSSFGKVMDYLTIGMVLLMMMTPALGGVLTDIFGWESTFIVFAALTLILMAWVIFGIENDSRQDSASTFQRGILKNAWILLRTPNYQHFAGTASCSLAIILCFTVAATFLGIGVLKLSPTFHGILFALVGFLYIFGVMFAHKNIGHETEDKRLRIKSGSTFAFLLSIVGGSVFLLVPLTPWSLYGFGALIFFPLGLSLPVSLKSLPVSLKSAVGMGRILKKNDPAGDGLPGAASGLTGMLQTLLAASASVFVILAMDAFDNSRWPIVLTIFCLAAFSVGLLPFWSDEDTSSEVT